MTPSFASTYPNIAHFVDAIGIIEIGYHHDFPVTSFIRAIEEGGMAWEGEDQYPTLDVALAALEAGLGEWMKEMGLNR
jgi:hypothetical protein